MFRGINAAAVGLVFATVFLLFQRALSIVALKNNTNQLGPLPIGDSPLYATAAAAAFICAGAFFRLNVHMTRVCLHMSYMRHAMLVCEEMCTHIHRQ